ncbi:hypothetical protein BC830DRAFT_1134561 [Chytriomyces sp. MP71]|nr:hypothetical protein BC830DRAFT_1134561 [Chytriomyces sp. MP71]
MSSFTLHASRLRALLIAATHLDTSEVWWAVMSQVQVFAAVKGSSLPFKPSETASSSSSSSSSITISRASLSVGCLPARTEDAGVDLVQKRQKLVLPHDIIVAIMEFVNPGSLHQCARVSRAWNDSVTPLMYSNPHLSSVFAISNYLCLMEESRNTIGNGPGRPLHHHNWEFHSLARSVTFTRQVITDEAGVTTVKYPDDLVKSQSSIFRLLVLDRLNAGWYFVHPLFVRLVEACQRIDEASEMLSDDNVKRRTVEKRNRRQTNGQWHINNTNDQEEEHPSTAVLAASVQAAPTLTSDSATDMPNFIGERPPLDTLMDPTKLLTNLVKLCRRVLSICSAFGLSPETAVDSLLLLLALFETREVSFWRGFPATSFKHIKAIVFARLRHILNAISTSILIEVQYITVSSQRLLDIYCMMYYRALAHANSLNLNVVLDVLQNAARDIKIQEDQDFGSSSTARQNRSIHKPAHRVLQALQLMFHKNLFNLPPSNRRERMRAVDTLATVSPTAGISEDEAAMQVVARQEPQARPPQNNDTSPFSLEDYDFDTLGGLLTSRAALREGLMSFAPGSMNSETAEFIDELLDDNEDLETQLNSDGLPAEEHLQLVEVAKCVRWMKEVVKWQRAGKQMEPVKDLLRRSMARIDRLRIIQRRYGIYFME